MTAPTQPTPKCEQCGYDVQGLSQDSRCPECGWEIGELRRLNRINRLGLAKGQVIRWHAACTECGYDLQGLMLDQQCPECGTPLLHSFGARLLRYAPVESVSSLYKSSSQLPLGYLLTAPLVLGCAPNWGLLGLLYWTAGVLWLSKTRQPGMPGRATAMLGCAVTLIAIAIVAPALLSQQPPVIWAWAVLGSTFMVSNAGLLTLMSHVAKRLNDRPLRLAQRWLLWLIPVPLAAIVLAVLRDKNLLGPVPEGWVLAALLGSGTWYLGCGLATFGFASAVGAELTYARQVTEAGAGEPATPADSPVD